MKSPSSRGPMDILPLNEMIERSARLYAPNVALRKRTPQGWSEYTYAHLLSCIKRLANYLIKTGHSKGCFIGIIGDNSPEWVMAFMATQWIGGVVVPLDSRAKEMELSHIIEHSGLRTIFASPRLVGLLKGLIQRGDLKKKTLLISLEAIDGCDHLPQVFSAFKDDARREEMTIEDLAIVQYTSGTTGNPKGVVLTHKNLSSNIHSLYQAVFFNQKDRFFSVLPIHHVYEGTAGNWLPLSVGASITYSRSLKSKEMLEDARDTEPTVMLAVPLLLEKMLVGIQKRLEDSAGYVKKLMFLSRGCACLLNFIHRQTGSTLVFGALRRKMGFGKLRFFVSGGAALPSWVQKGLEDFGFVVLQGYGQSESSPVLTLNPPGGTRRGSIGLPIPGVEIKIIDPGAGGIGEIAAKGDNIMSGYYKNKADTRGAFTGDGFLLTGDMGYVDPEGFFFITGRRKSIIVTKGGENVYPEEIEGLLLKSPFIEEILVVRGHNLKTGDEEVQAIIYPNSNELERHFSEERRPSPGEEDIWRLIKKEIDERSRRLAPYKRIVHFTLRNEEFPKTTTNKIKRYLFEKRDLRGN